MIDAQAIRADHYQTGSICISDGARWPCRISRLLDALAAERTAWTWRIRNINEHLDLWHTEHGDAEWATCDYPQCEALRAILAVAEGTASE